MTKLLVTRLPLAEGTDVTPELFNRLIRILEINLDNVDQPKIYKKNQDIECYDNEKCILD